VTAAACAVGSADNCASIDGCEYHEAVTQAESCVAIDLDACAEVQEMFDGGVRDKCTDRANDCCANADAGEPATCSDGFVASTQPTSFDNCPNYACFAPGTAYDPPTAETCTNAGAGGCTYVAPTTPQFLGCYQDSEGTGGSAILLAGNTYADGDFGLTFDGEGDYAVIEASAGGTFAAGGDFTVAFYFTRQDCYTPDRWQALYSHHGIGVYPKRGTLHANRERDAVVRDSVEIYLGCASASGQESLSTLPTGDIIRFVIGDHAGSKLTFDVSTSAEQTNGFITDTWAHLVLSVDGPGGSVNTILDGRPINSNFGTATVRDGTFDWAQSPESNLAYHATSTDSEAGPLVDPRMLSGVLGAFKLAGGSDGPVCVGLAI
jgi:hypothetical protein